MAVNWLILASIVTLAFGSPEPAGVNSEGMSDEEAEHMKAVRKCCYADRVVSLDLKDSETCSESAGIDDEGSSPTDEQMCEMHECILEENGLLKEDKSINKAKLKKAFLHKADPTAKSVAKAALNRCFEELEGSGEEAKGGSCKSGIDSLLGCFAKEVYANCPKKLWDMTTKECKAARKKEIENKRLRLLAECCYADRVLSLDLKGTDSCSESAGLDKDSPPSAEKVCAMQECALEKNQLLNEDKSINKEEIKKAFLDKADPETKPVVEAALGRCFEEKTPNKAKGGSCKSGAGSLLECFTKEIHANCPDKLWDMTNKKCKAVKEKENEQRLMSLFMKCCNADHVVKFDSENMISCQKSSKPVGGKKSAPSDKKVCSMYECVLGKSGLLKKDKSIKENEFRKEILEKADPDSKPAVEVALNTCFDELNNNPGKAKSKTCKSGVSSLIGCLTLEVHYNCPDNMWDKNNPECQGSKEKLLNNHNSNGQQKDQNGKTKK